MLSLLAPMWGCTGTWFLVQAGWGQLELQALAEPLDKTLANPATPSKLRQVLANVDSIRHFGAQHGLQTSKNYRSFAQLDRSAAVWVVTAAPPLSLQAKTWKFPLVGSFPYLGWFDHRDAHWFAARLQDQGLDVHVRGAAAYSTLGWFEDPILSTMITPGPHALGNLADSLLHESVHATIYIEGQGAFNESLASFAAERLTPIYLSAQCGSTSRELAAYRASEKRRKNRIKFLQKAYTNLKTLYASQQPDDVKLAEKSRILNALQKDLGDERPRSNAALAGFRTYQSNHPALQRFLQTCDNNWKRFFQALSLLAPTAFAEEQQADLTPLLHSLAHKKCQVDQSVDRASP